MRAWWDRVDLAVCGIACCGVIATGYQWLDALFSDYWLDRIRLHIERNEGYRHALLLAAVQNVAGILIYAALRAGGRRGTGIGESIRRCLMATFALSAMIFFPGCNYLSVAETWSSSHPAMLAREATNAWIVLTAFLLAILGLLATIRWKRAANGAVA